VVVVLVGTVVEVLVVGFAGVRAGGIVVLVEDVDELVPTDVDVVDDPPAPAVVDVVELEVVDELVVEVVVCSAPASASVGRVAVSRADTARTAPATARVGSDTLGALPPGGLGRASG
jgi:hypothetical protein